jgi:hypothetical protein
VTLHGAEVRAPAHSSRAVDLAVSVSAAELCDRVASRVRPRTRPSRNQEGSDSCSRMGRRYARGAFSDTSKIGGRLAGPIVEDFSHARFSRDAVQRLDGDPPHLAHRGAGNREFLKDVSAFANTAGGDLLIGMDEQDGIVTAIPGLEGDRDAILLRLEQVATANLTPRVVGLTMRAIPLASGKFVIAVRVPRSWLGPHRVEAEGLPVLLPR